MALCLPRKTTSNAAPRIDLQPAIQAHVQPIIERQDLEWIEVDPFGTIQCFAGSENNATEITFAADVTDDNVSSAMTSLETTVDRILSDLKEINIKVAVSCYGKGETFVESQFVLSEGTPKTIAAWVESVIRPKLSQ